VNAFEAEILQYPWLFVSLLNGVVTVRLGVKRVEVKRGDEEGLKRFYTSPRAEARVLVLVGEGEVSGKGAEDKKEKETGLESKVEGLAIGKQQ
jgi:hypothetical protein